MFERTLLFLATAIAGCGGTEAPPQVEEEFPDGTRILPATDSGPETGAPAASPGCGDSEQAFAPGSTTTAEIEHGGIVRTFSVRVPTSYDDGIENALMIVLHGGLGSGPQVEQSTGMSTVAERQGFIAVYPDGTAGSSGARTWNAGGCCGESAATGVDDVGFILAIIDEIGSSACVDERRIYATGISNGAMLSHRLACDASTRITAIAPVSGSLMAEPCEPERPVPVFAVHGTDDANVPWEGGVGCGLAGVAFTSVDATMDFWAAHDGCNGARTNVVTQGDGSCDSYGTCAGGASVVLCTIAGGGHAWPGGAPRLLVLPECEAAGEGAQSTTFLASDRIWEFFEPFAL